MRIHGKGVNTLAALLLAAPVHLLAAEQAPPYPPHWPGWHSHWPGLWWICPVLFLVMLVVFFVVLLSRRDHDGWHMAWRWMGGLRDPDRLHGQGPGSREECALDILNKRYARGELEREEYEEKKRAIASVD